jgi:hypothetical protein
MPEVGRVLNVIAKQEDSHLKKISGLVETNCKGSVLVSDRPAKHEHCILAVKKKNEAKGCDTPEGDGSKRCPNAFAVCARVKDVKEPWQMSYISKLAKKIAHSKAESQQNALFLSVYGEDRVNLLRYIILSMPIGAYLLKREGYGSPSLEREIINKYGTYAGTNDLEKIVRGLSTICPDRVSADFALGLDEVILKDSSKGEMSDPELSKVDAALKDIQIVAMADAGKGSSQECAFVACRTKNNSLVRGAAACGDESTVEVDLTCPGDSKAAALVHNHPSGILYPSGTDMETSRKHNIAMCVKVGENIKCFRPNIDLPGT